jgi:hypothetical protein
MLNEIAVSDDSQRTNSDQIEGQSQIGNRETTQNIIHRTADVNAEI